MYYFPAFRRNTFLHNHIQSHPAHPGSHPHRWLTFMTYESRRNMRKWTSTTFDFSRLLTFSLSHSTILHFFIFQLSFLSSTVSSLKTSRSRQRLLVGVMGMEMKAANSNNLQSSEIKLFESLKSRMGWTTRVITRKTRVKAGKSEKRRLNSFPCEMKNISNE